MTIEDRAEQIASAFETIEAGRWRTYEAVHEFVNEVAGKQDRAHRVQLLADRIGRSKAAVRLWCRAVETVPGDLRYAKLPVATCLWAAQNLTADEAATWLEQADNNGWSLTQLKREMGLSDTSTLTTPTLRRILRSFAADLPAAADAEAGPDTAAALEKALADVVAPFLDAQKPPPTTDGGC